MKNQSSRSPFPVRGMPILFLFFLCLCQYASARDDKILVATELQDVTGSDLQRVETEARNGAEKICKQLGISNSKIIKIKIVRNGICYASRGMIYLPIWYVQNKKAAIVHEITHILANHGENRFFSEGLAVCFQEKFGTDDGFPNFEGLPLDMLVKRHKADLMSLSGLDRNNGIFDPKNQVPERRMAYIEAGSFISYLLSQYGDQKIQDLNQSTVFSYLSVYGKDLKDLEMEWKPYVFDSQNYGSK